MKTWARVKDLEHCGYCRAELGAGMAMQIWTLPNLKRRVIRCETCVGPAPPSLPVHVKIAPMTKRMQPIKTAADILKSEWQRFKD